MCGIYGLATWNGLVLPESFCLLLSSRLGHHSPFKIRIRVQHETHIIGMRLKEAAGWHQLPLKISHISVREIIGHEKLSFETSQEEVGVHIGSMLYAALRG